ncbi:GTPase-activating and VPS9 domain-containing 1-like [Pelobates cultripes]|uniref:GTPase-activating and VPS9 domain-containing 1-like n=1 Tax=Pelobates cultripes TaxID=61616 RepID=A0AAD1RRT2_PELCU|nr:GTPase-activating and VPS9 domain-containing 1-like [Pelobates cultripes]
MTICVRLLLESKEKKIQEFIQDFQKLTAADDKTARVEEFLQSLYGAMAQDSLANTKGVFEGRPSAQAEIHTLSAYKTPRDKVQCILRMCSTIMNLLSLANEYSVPGADDFVPVLVFVLIKANPPCLLSTVQYINNFYTNRLTGEEYYCCMQFTAAVKFIKTIDDRK